MPQHLQRREFIQASAAAAGVITPSGCRKPPAPPLGRQSTPRCTPMSVTIRAGHGPALWSDRRR